MNKIIAKFNSTCAETGKPLVKGTTIYHDPVLKKAFHPDSQRAKDWEASQAGAKADDKAAQDERDVAGYIQSQEDAYWDNQARDLF